MNYMKNKYNNESLTKNQNYFCISLLLQLIEEIELDYSNNTPKNNNIHNKLLFSIFSLLKLEINILRQLFLFQNKHMYNIIQFQEMKNIFDNGKNQIKKIIKEILSYSKSVIENKNTKNINNNYNNYTNSNSNIYNIFDNKKLPSPTKKKYNTKTYNNNMNNYLNKNEERKTTNEYRMTTIPKSIDYTSTNSIPSFHIYKQNKYKKNICNIKKNHSKTFKNINGNSKSKKDLTDKCKTNTNTNTNTNKVTEDNNTESFYYKLNTKNTISTKPNKIIPKKICVNQINRVNTNINKKRNIKANKDKNYVLTSPSLPTQFIDENPVRKVKNIIINAKNLSSLNIDVINQYLYHDKTNSDNRIQNSNSFNSISKSKIHSNNTSSNIFKQNDENKTYTLPFYINNQSEQKININRVASKDRKSNEMLIDGMKNIKMKLNSIEKNKKIKKAKSISDLNYIKNIMKK